MNSKINFSIYLKMFIMQRNKDKTDLRGDKSVMGT